jgi:hypothetical protein
VQHGSTILIVLLKDREFCSIVPVQTIFGSDPDDPFVILVNVVDQTAG